MIGRNRWSESHQWLLLRVRRPLLFSCSWGGPACRSDYLSQQPGAVYVEYGQDLVVVEIDAQTRACSSTDDPAFANAIRIYLVESVDGRSVEARSL